MNRCSRIDQLSSFLFKKDATGNALETAKVGGHPLPSEALPLKPFPFHDETVVPAPDPSGLQVTPPEAPHWKIPYSLEQGFFKDGGPWLFVVDLAHRGKKLFTAGSDKMELEKKVAEGADLEKELKKADPSAAEKIEEGAKGAGKGAIKGKVAKGTGKGAAALKTPGDGVPPPQLDKGIWNEAAFDSEEGAEGKFYNFFGCAKKGNISGGAVSDCHAAPNGEESESCVKAAELCKNELGGDWKQCTHENLSWIVNRYFAICDGDSRIWDHKSVGILGVRRKKKRWAASPWSRYARYGRGRVAFC